MKNAKMALIYDFDHTLSPKDMQEFHLIKRLGFRDPEAFWMECGKNTELNNMDGILSYMQMMIKYDPSITRDELISEGKYIRYYKGVDTWFDRINEYGKQHNVDVEHYIISSGIKELLLGTSIAPFFKEIYACTYAYDESGKAVWPSRVINYTTKTQYIFRINKGVLDETNDSDLNRSTPDEEKAVPFSNIVYFGDGLTDVPSMKVVLQQGGQTVAVYDSKDAQNRLTRDLMKDKRATYAMKADYSAGSKMENLVMGMIDSTEVRSRLDKFR